MSGSNTSFQSYTALDAIDPSNTFTFNTGFADKSTGYKMRLAFGMYDYTYFNNPVDFYRFGTIKVYMFNQLSSVTGGITIT